MFLTIQNVRTARDPDLLVFFGKIFEEVFDAFGDGFGDAFGELVYTPEILNDIGLDAEDLHPIGFVGDETMGQVIVDGHRQPLG